MEEIELTRSGMAALIAVIAYLSGRFNDLFWILCFLMLIDYFTGYVSAWVTRTHSSRIGFIGILKKLMYITFVIFGFMLDMSIIRILQQLHINFSFADIGNISLGVIIMIFYIGNETISIVENFNKMGLKVPKWMSRIGYILRDIPNMVLKPLFKKTEEEMKDLDNKSEINENELIDKTKNEEEDK